MGLNLNTLTAEAQLDAGTTVADLDPTSVDPSFITDRLGELYDEDFNSLLQSIKVNGQLVPILVRPHPDKP